MAVVVVFFSSVPNDDDATNVVLAMCGGCTCVVKMLHLRLLRLTRAAGLVAAAATALFSRTPQQCVVARLLLYIQIL